MSHSPPLVVALATATGAVGVDVERIEAADARLGRKVLTETERERLPSGEEARRRAVVMHFSIKEAVYKALEPGQQAHIDFEDIETVIAEPRLHIWTQVDVRILSPSHHIRGAIISEGDWVVAAAIREP